MPDYLYISKQGNKIYGNMDQNTINFVQETALPGWGSVGQWADPENSVGAIWQSSHSHDVYAPARLRIVNSGEWQVSTRDKESMYELSHDYRYVIVDVYEQFDSGSVGVLKAHTDIIEALDGLDQFTHVVDQVGNDIKWYSISQASSPQTYVKSILANHTNFKISTRDPNMFYWVG